MSSLENASCVICYRRGEYEAGREPPVVIEEGMCKHVFHTQCFLEMIQIYGPNVFCTQCHGPMVPEEYKDAVRKPRLKFYPLIFSDLPWRRLLIAIFAAIVYLAVRFGINALQGKQFMNTVLDDWIVQIYNYLDDRAALFVSLVSRSLAFIGPFRLCLLFLFASFEIVKGILMGWE